jgi:hypothetical protein
MWLAMAPLAMRSDGNSMLPRTKEFGRLPVYFREFGRILTLKH